MNEFSIKLYSCIKYHNLTKILVLDCELPKETSDNPNYKINSNNTNTYLFLLTNVRRMSISAANELTILINELNDLFETINIAISIKNTQS